MIWNNRIISKDHGQSKGGTLYGLFEVFYNSRGKVETCTKEPAFGWFESPKELKQCLSLMMKDANRKNGILRYEDMGDLNSQKSPLALKPKTLSKKLGKSYTKLLQKL